MAGKQFASYDVADGAQKRSVGGKKGKRRRPPVLRVKGSKKGK